eukprot:14031326-Heterocapsa_arctica.AAC.1
MTALSVLKEDAFCTYEDFVKEKSTSTKVKSEEVIDKMEENCLVKDKTNLESVVLEPVVLQQSNDIVLTDFEMRQM